MESVLCWLLLLLLASQVVGSDADASSSIPDEDVYCGKEQRFLRTRSHVTGILHLPQIKSD